MVWLMVCRVRGALEFVVDFGRRKGRERELFIEASFADSLS